MAGIFTNYLFGKDIFNYIYDENIRHTMSLAKKAFELGLQGPEIFESDQSGIAYSKLIHNNNTYEFLQNMLKTAMSLGDANRNIALAYTYGFLSHFALDVSTNPYIHYMAGFKIDNESEIPEYNACIAYFENEIDKRMLITKRGLRLDQLRRQDLIGVSDRELTIISNLLSHAIKKTFNMDIGPRNIYNMYNSYKFMNIILQDNRVPRYTLLSSLEASLMKSPKVKGILISRNLPIAFDPLNTECYGWCAPWNDKVTNYDSFMELYEKGLAYATRLINEADSFVRFNTKSYNLRTLIDNRSYITGQDCQKVFSNRFFRGRESHLIQIR